MVKPNSLTRVRCMVQDMFDPEYYLGVYQVKDADSGNTTVRSGKYKDVAECGVRFSVIFSNWNKCLKQFTSVLYKDT